MITDVALNQMIKALQQGVSPDIELRYLALGNSNSPVLANQTQLVNEVFRTPILSQNAIGAQLTNVFSVLATEAVGQIHEIGIFGGSSATLTFNSGIMISRILFSRLKTNSEEIQFTRLDRMVR